MSRIDIVRTDVAMPEAGAMKAVGDFLFRCLDGLGQDDRRAWRKFWKRITSMEPGEWIQAEMLFPRSGKFHRRHMAIESAVFDAQERFTDREQFRVWLKVGAGWVDWCAGPKGGVVPIPRSISYAKADQEEFTRYHYLVIGFLRGPHAAKFLWRHLNSPADMMDSILEGFNE